MSILFIAAYLGIGIVVVTIGVLLKVDISYESQWDLNGQRIQTPRYTIWDTAMSKIRLGEIGTSCLLALLVLVWPIIFPIVVLFSFTWLVGAIVMKVVDKRTEPERTEKALQDIANGSR